MPISLTESVRIVVALVGLVSIFLGYRLFFSHAGHRHISRSFRLTSLASGTLLAVFGTAIVIGAVFVPAAGGARSKPNWEKNSVERGLISPGRRSNSFRAWQRFV